MSKLHYEIQKNKNKAFQGKEAEVLVDQKGLENFPNTTLARDENYKLYAVFSKEKLLGKKVKIKVTKATPFYLISESIKS